MGNNIHRQIWNFILATRNILTLPRVITFNTCHFTHVSLIFLAFHDKSLIVVFYLSCLPLNFLEKLKTNMKTKTNTITMTKTKQKGIQKHQWNSRIDSIKSGNYYELKPSEFIYKQIITYWNKKYYETRNQYFNKQHLVIKPTNSAESILQFSQVSNSRIVNFNFASLLNI